MNSKIEAVFSLKDMLQLHNISMLQFSPNGQHLSIVASKADIGENCGKDLIFILPMVDEIGIPKLIVEGSSVSWSPDSLNIAYVSSEGKLSVYNLNNKKTNCLCEIFYSSHFINHLEEKGILWSPDGYYIAFPGTALSFDTGHENEVRVINRIMYKSKGGRGRPFFNDNRLTHIYIVPASGGEPEIITPGEYNEHSISWSPDGTQLAFISNRSSDPDNNQFSDLWRVDRRTKEVVRLTDGIGTAYQPSWSPDGKFIAFLAVTNKNNTNDSTADDTHIYMLPGNGGHLVCLTKSLDRRVGNICWHPKGNYIYFTAENEGKTSIYRVSIVSSVIELVLGGDYKVLGFSLGSEGESIAYIRTGINHPTEVFLADGLPLKSIQVTRLNEDLVNKCRLENAETFKFKSFDGTRIQGWLIKPDHIVTAQKVPLILVIHGGPHNMFGFEFEGRMQLLCAAGYGVLFINPRGSSGYGQKFSEGNVMNWGGGDYQDLMIGLDHVISQNGWIDGARLGVTGQSYGGFMTNWIITQTNRFNAAVVDGGISNLISFYGTSLYHSLIESEFNGKASGNYPLLWQWSPLRNVSFATTPTLFLHGELDNEVPFSQAEEMYIGLKKCGVNTVLVQYIGEGHGWRPDLKPQNQVDLYTRMIKWFNQYI